MIVELLLLRLEISKTPLEVHSTRSCDFKNSMLITDRTYRDCAKASCEV